jgi:hypothetical protein
MGNFKQQIQEDINLLKEENSKANTNINNDDFAFNLWILTRMFQLDEAIAMTQITDLSDKGIDCWYFSEEDKELYLIQNKYYNNSQVEYKSIVDSFLSRPIAHLKEGLYKKSEELQNIFTKYKNDREFKVHFHLYTTQDFVDEQFRKKFDGFKNDVADISASTDARVFFLPDIEEEYFGSRQYKTQKFDFTITTKFQKTQLNIDPSAYNLPYLLKSRYILTPVRQIYELLQSAIDKDYQLFQENIREFLGKKGVNGGIIRTLEDKEDRNNFFFYNNGVTIICDSFVNDGPKQNTKIHNPQIVNGCQTVNSIYDVIKRTQVSELPSFDNTFVMVKLLQIDRSQNTNNNDLYMNIVKYNNSQNAIKAKDFVANKDVFKNLQIELGLRGFALYIKQSDRFKFSSNLKLVQDYRKKAVDRFKFIGINKVKDTDLGIELIKLLQVLLAFTKSGYHAFQNKSQCLDASSQIHKDLVDIIEKTELTIEQITKIWLYYFKSSKEQKESEDQRTPTPYYVLGFMGKYYKNSKEKELIFMEENVESFYSFFSWVSNSYVMLMKNAGIEYNNMVKKPIDEIKLSTAIDVVKQFPVLKNEQKKIINRFMAQKD